MEGQDSSLLTSPDARRFPWTLQARKMTSMSEDILEARAKVKKIRSLPKTRLRKRSLRTAEKKLAELRDELANGAKEVLCLTARAVTATMTVCSGVVQTRIRDSREKVLLSA